MYEKSGRGESNHLRRRELEGDIWFGVQDYGIFTCFLIRERRKKKIPGII